jgi:hypothetical protein
MIKKIQFVLLLFVVACLERYEFEVRDREPGLVIEATLTDKSYLDTQAYSDGQYFTVRLSETSDVNNVRSKTVNHAIVELLTSEGETFSCVQVANGTYSLLDQEFKARKGVDYRLRIVTPDEHVYESSWERLPDIDAPSIGAVDFAEGTMQKYIMEASDWKVRERQVVTTSIEVPVNTSGKSIYYKYSMLPTWIYEAPLTSQANSNYRCWITEPYYMENFELLVDRAGGYKKALFNIETVRNERIYKKFSVLITQHAMTADVFSFWKDLKDRNETSALADTPPYNLKTNYTSPTGGKKVYGYFGACFEQATRWYFDREQLSYYVEDTMRADCLIVYGPDGPAPMCFDCLQYPSGEGRNVKPFWWNP